MRPSCNHAGRIHKPYSDRLSAPCPGYPVLAVPNWGKEMKSKSLIMLFVSLGFGLIAAIGISQVMGGNRATSEPVTQKVTVVVAKVAIDHESILNDETVRLEEWPLNIVPEDAVRDLKDLTDMVVATRVLKGLPLCKSNLLNKNQVKKLPIPPGKKVIAVPLDAEDTFGGLLQPGDRVDIVGVFMENNRGTEVATPRTFLKNIQVFSVDESYVRDLVRETSGSKGKTNVGVLVTEKESEILTLALGSRIKLKFVLCADTGDTESQIVEPVSTASDPVRPDQKTLSTLLGDMFDKTSSTPGFQTVVFNGSEREVIKFDSKGNVIGSSNPDSPLNGAVSGVPQLVPAPTGSDLTGGADSGNSTSDNYRFEEDQYPGG